MSGSSCPPQAEGLEGRLLRMNMERQVLVLQLEALRREKLEAEKDLEAQHGRHMQELHTLREEGLQVDTAGLLGKGVSREYSHFALLVTFPNGKHHGGVTPSCRFLLRCSACTARCLRSRRRCWRTGTGVCCRMPSRMPSTCRQKTSSCRQRASGFTLVSEQCPLPHCGMRPPRAKYSTTWVLKGGEAQNK